VPWQVERKEGPAARAIARHLSARFLLARPPGMIRVSLADKHFYCN
jgi:hypothetical protein